jgi:hypothetical protein
MNVLNSEYFQKWIVNNVKITNSQERYLFTEFDERLLEKIYERYTVNGSVDFLDEKYFLWCFKDPSNHNDFNVRDKVSYIGYSDLVTARNQPSANKINFIVLIPKESQALPSNSSDSTSLEISQSEKSYSNYILEDFFDSEFKYLNVDRIKQLGALLFEKHPNDCYHFFLKEINKDKILDFYGVLGEEKHLDNKEISKCTYYVAFIDRITKVLSDESYSGLSERLNSHNVENFEIVIQRFWEENYDSAKLLADNINLIFFRDTEFYKQHINVDEWIIALSEEDVDTDYFIEYENKLNSDFFSVINSKNKSKCSGGIVISNDMYVNNEEILTTFLSKNNKCDWKVNNNTICSNSLSCEINERNTFLQIQSELQIAHSKKDKKSLKLIYYTLNTLPDENAMDFAFSISAYDEKNVLSKIELSEFKDETKLNELSEFKTALLNNIVSILTLERSEVEYEINNSNQEDDSTLFFEFKKEKTILNRNGQITIDIRTIDPDSSLSLIAYQNEDKEITFNFMDHEEINVKIKNENFKNYEFVISEITEGILFFNLKNSRTGQIKRIIVAIDPEANMKDEFVSNYFQKLQAQNDSSFKNTVFKIKKKSINNVHAYYFTDKFGLTNEKKLLPTVFNICDEMVLNDEVDKCPSIGELHLSPPDFIPNLKKFEEISNTPEIREYINTRDEIYNILSIALRNKISIDEIDFSSLQLLDLVDKQLINYQKLIEIYDVAIWLDLFFIVLKNDNYFRMDDEALALFLSPLHPIFLSQVLTKSRILSETIFGTNGKPNSLGSALQLNTLQNWVLNFKKENLQHFVNIETDSLLFTGFINFNKAYKPNELSSILKRYDVNYNQSVGYLSYSQIKSALKKSYTYLSNKPEFNICLKSELYDSTTNRAVLDWIKEANDEMKVRYSNQKIFINIFDERDERLNSYPDNNLISYYKNELGLDFNWYKSDDQTNFDSFDVTILTSAIQDKIYKYQDKNNLLSNSFAYRNLFNYNLIKIEGSSVYSDIFSQQRIGSNNIDNIINALNNQFQNALEKNKNQIENRLISSTKSKTQVLAISSEISNTNVLERTQNKSLWEFSISDYSFKDSSRGDYFLLAEQQDQYIDKFKRFLIEIDPNTENILNDFLDYSKTIGLFQLKNLLSNQNFLKEFIACVTARKLIDCVIVNKINTIVVPYDLFQPRLSKINKEIASDYKDKGTQYPDFILIEFTELENRSFIDFRLIEIKYRSNVLPELEIDTILKNQTSRIKEIFHELNCFRNNYHEISLWKHTLSIILAEMFSYFHDNTEILKNDSSILFNRILNSDYEFRLNDSLLIAIDGSDKFEFGQIKEGIFYKIPRNAIHQIFDCDSSINSNFGRMYDSMLREDTSYKFMEKNIDYLNNQGEQGTNKEKLTLEISEVHLIPSEENHESNFQKPNAAETESKSSNDELITLEKSDDINKQEEKSNETKKVDVLPYQPEVNSTLIAKPKISLGLNVDTGKNVEFNPVTMIPKKLANQHLLIVGKSGAGKSQTTSSILYELSREDIPFLILDFQGEYISSVLTNSNDQSFAEATNAMTLDPSYGMDINPLELSLDGNTGQKIGYMSNVYQVSSILKQIFGLGDIQNPVLKDAIKRAYQEKGFSVNDRNTWNNEAPQFQDIWSILEFMEQTEGANVRNLKYRIEPLFENNIFVSNGQGTSINNVLNRNSIIDLSKLHTPELMKSVARFVLQAVYNRMIAEGPSKRIKLYVVIDEAHKLSYDQTLTDLIREARKYGVGFILASQSVRDFATVVFENMGTKIALQLEGEDAKYMAENFGATDKTSKEAVLSMLPTQKPLRALIRNNHYEPFVQVDIKPFYEK